jgi:uncharacterized membrane protein
VDIYFSFQAALCFSIAHILIRRGLVESNAMTGSFISLSMSAVTLWALVPFLASFSGLWRPALLIFVAAGILAPGVGRTLSYVGIEKIGVARSVPIANSSPIFASIFAVVFLAEAWVLPFLGNVTRRVGSWVVGPIVRGTFEHPPKMRHVVVTVPDGLGRAGHGSRNDTGMIVLVGNDEC